MVESNIVIVNCNDIESVEQKHISKFLYIGIAFKNKKETAWYRLGMVATFQSDVGTWSGEAL